MKLDNRNEKDIKDIKKCVNEIILYLLLNRIDTRNGFDKEDIKNSKELKAENFKDVKTYIKYISKKMKEDIYETIFFDEDDEEEDSNFEIMSALRSIFIKYLPILSSLHADNSDAVSNIIGKYITWEF